MIIFENTVTTPLVLVALGAFILVALWSALRSLSPGPTRWILFLLHTLTILAIGWCLFMPGRKTSITQLLKPRFLVALDTSRSMAIDPPNAGDPTRWKTALKALESPWADRLSSECDIDLYPFSSSLSEPVSLGHAAKLQPDGDSTALRDALTGIEQRLSGLQIQGMILLSDGSDTKEALDDWASTPRMFPIHTLRLEKPGGREVEADMRIDSLEAPRRVTAGWKSEMKLKVSGQGTKGNPVMVQLFENDALVAEKPTQIPEAGGERDVSFELNHSKVGVSNYRVFIPPLPGEKNTADNEWKAIVEVVDARNRLLYVEGVPRWEYKYLRRVLLGERQISPVIFFTSGDGKPQAATPVENFTADMTNAQLSAFKIVVLGNLDAAELGSERAERLVEFVEKGGSLVFLGGPKTWGPGGLLATPLAKILPVTGGSPQPLEGEKPFPVKLTSQAAGHPAFAGDPNFWKKIPPVLSVFTGLQAKPAAESLVVAETPSGEIPVVLTQRFGEGKVAVMLTDTLWRWQLGPESEDARPYKRFWSQLVSWLLPKEDAGKSEKLEIFADRDDLHLGEAVNLNARVADSLGKKPDAIDAKITYPDGREVPYSMAAQRVSTPSGDSFDGYSVEFKPDVPGAYRVNASIQGTPPVASKPIGFFVKPHSPETSPRPPKTEILQAISASSGGSYFETIEALDAAMSSLNLKAKEENFSEFHTLWRDWPVLIALMLLFTITWTIRRKRQMP